MSRANRPQLLPVVDESITVTVCDHGPGVAEEALAELFHAFFRVADARDRDSGGTGLGLAIAERAIRLHGGTISACNRDEGGLCIEVRYPVCGFGRATAAGMEEHMAGKSFEDTRPDVWVGHIELTVPDVQACRTFFAAMGMRDLDIDADIAILELRGGTHLILQPGGEAVDGASTPFDLMVDDVKQSHADMAAAGLQPSPVQAGHIHDTFTLAVPSGHVATVCSTHVSGKPV